MRKLQNISTLIVLLFAVSCVGQKDPGSEYKITITASQPNINVDESESVQLRVKNHSVDITDQAEIYYTVEGKEIEVTGGLFTATESGEYSFSARFGGVESEGHAVVRAYNASEVTSEYYRRNIVMKFTGTWCVNCPKMGNSIIELEHAMPNRIIEMSVHSNDQLECEDGKSMAKYVETIVTGDGKFFSLPTTYADMSSYTTTPSLSVLKELVDGSIAANATVAGVRAKTSLDGKSLTVEVGVNSSVAASYKLAVALVTDNFNYPQKGADDPSYKQDKVLQFYLSDIHGDSVEITTTNTEVVTNYTVDVPATALESESRIIAYVLNEVDGKFVVNNATECVIGETIDYMYEIAE